jgi:WD40 repeat protein
VAAPSHSCAVTAVTVSRDGEMIASGDAEGGVKVWRTSTGTCLVRFRGVHTASVCALSFSADGSLLASGSTDQNAHVLGLKAGAALTSLPGHSGFVNDVAFVDDRIVTACADGKVRVFTAKNGECLASVLPAGSSVGAADTPLLAVCPVPKFHSDLVLAIPRASAAYLLQLPSGRPVLTLSVTGHVTAAHVADDADPSLSSAAASSSGTSWRVHDADEIVPLHATTTTTAAAAAHTASSGSSGAQSASAAAGSSEASKAAAARAAASAGGGGGASAQVFVAGTLSALGRWALLATNHGRLLAFDLVARRLERTVAVSESERDIVLPPEVLCVRMHPLDNIVATCAREPSVRLWTP